VVDDTLAVGIGGVDGTAGGAGVGDPGSIGEVQSWGGLISILILIPTLTPILTSIPMANKNSKNPITGITAKIRKVTTQM